MAWMNDTISWVRKEDKKGEKGLREEKSKLNVKAPRNKNAICSQRFK